MKITDAKFKLRLKALTEEYGYDKMNYNDLTGSQNKLAAFRCGVEAAVLNLFPDEVDRINAFWKDLHEADEACINYQFKEIKELKTSLNTIAEAFKAVEWVGNGKRTQLVKEQPMEARLRVVRRAIREAMPVTMESPEEKKV